MFMCFVTFVPFLSTPWFPTVALITVRTECPSVECIPPPGPNSPFLYSLIDASQLIMPDFVLSMKIRALFPEK